MIFLLHLVTLPLPAIQPMTLNMPVFQKLLWSALKAWRFYFFQMFSFRRRDNFWLDHFGTRASILAQWDCPKHQVWKACVDCCAWQLLARPGQVLGQHPGERHLGAEHPHRRASGLWARLWSEAHPASRCHRPSSGDEMSGCHHLIIAYQLISGSLHRQPRGNSCTNLGCQGMVLSLMFYFYLLILSQ